MSRAKVLQSREKPVHILISVMASESIHYVACYLQGLVKICMVLVMMVFVCVYVCVCVRGEPVEIGPSHVCLSAVALIPAGCSLYVTSLSGGRSLRCGSYL
jgi:hypothetical protein